MSWSISYVDILESWKYNQLGSSWAFIKTGHNTLGIVHVLSNNRFWSLLLLGIWWLKSWIFRQVLVCLVKLSNKSFFYWHFKLIKQNVWFEALFMYFQTTGFAINFVEIVWDNSSCRGFDPLEQSVTFFFIKKKRLTWG